MANASTKRKRASNDAAAAAAPSKKAKSSIPKVNGHVTTKAKQDADLLNSIPARSMQIYVFGEGSAGELGLGPKNGTEVSRPRLNPNLASVVNISTGGMHAAAITADKRLLTWGVNDEKALGRDTSWNGGLRDAKDDSDSDDDADLNPRESTPGAVEALPKDAELVQVAAGDSATFMLTREGLVYGCGTFRDSNGTFGFTIDKDKIVKHQATPARIANLKDITSISVGADFALALDSKGQVYAWGPGQQSQLGRRIVERRRNRALLPERVELPKKQKIVSIHAGIDHAFAIDTEGNTWAWGLNNFAQTGISDMAGGEDAVIVRPKKVASLSGKKMSSISGGRHHSIGVTQAGECLVWGRMDGGQLGIDISALSDDKVMKDAQGKPRVLLQPTPVPIPQCKHVAAGPDHCIAVTAEGKAYSWGFNINYQCGQGTSDDINVATLMDNKAVRDVKLCWAGAGGQYSMLAAYQS